MKNTGGNNMTRPIVSREVLKNNFEMIEKNFAVFEKEYKKAGKKVNGNFTIQLINKVVDKTMKKLNLEKEDAIIFEGFLDIYIGMLPNVGDSRKAKELAFTLIKM